MIIHWPNARSSADPVDLGAQSDLIGAPEPMSIEAVPAAPTGGSGAAMALAFGSFRDRLTVSGTGPDGPARPGRMTAGKLRRRLFADRTPDRRTPAQAATQRTAVRVTSSAAATVTAVTTATAGHPPMRLASGCEPPIAVTYTAFSPAAAAGPDARYQSRAHQAAAANRVLPSAKDDELTVWAAEHHAVVVSTDGEFGHRRMQNARVRLVASAHPRNADGRPRPSPLWVPHVRALDVGLRELARRGGVVDREVTFELAGMMYAAARALRDEIWLFELSRDAVTAW